MSFRVRMILLIFFQVVLFAGCRRVHTFTPVEGTITKGGQPLSGFQVIFLADPDSGTEGPRSIGTTDATGHYRLQTDSGNDGAVTGKHRVCLVKLPPPEVNPFRKRRKDTASTKSKDDSAPTETPESIDSRIPAIYRSINETPLRAEVRSGGIQTIDFDIP